MQSSILLLQKRLQTLQNVLNILYQTLFIDNESSCWPYQNRKSNGDQDKEDVIELGNQWHLIPSFHLADRYGKARYILATQKRRHTRKRPS